MGARPKISHYLIHQETGQRYAVGEEVVIGRAHGDIIFADDPKLSSQHCRIFQAPRGLAVHDLGSSNGTYVDGIRLNPEKVYAFKAKSELNLGAQVFKLQEVNLAPKPRRRRKKTSRKKTSDHSIVSVLSALLLVGLALFYAQKYFGAKKGDRVAKLDMLSPFQLVEKEMKAAFAEYKELGRAKEAGELNDKGLATSIRKFLLPRLSAVHEKLDVIKPSGERERRKLAADKKLVMALIDQCTAMALHAETHDKKYEQDLEKASTAAAAAAEQVQKLER